MWGIPCYLAPAIGPILEEVLGARTPITISSDQNIFKMVLIEQREAE